MPHILLIVTGDLEKQSAVQSLRRHFPTHDTNNQPIIWLTPHKEDGTTSQRLVNSGEITSPMCRLATAMIASLEGHRANEPIPDLIIALDDLELDNTDQAPVVTDHLRRAIEPTLTDPKAARSLEEQERLRRELQNKCSFHFLNPMVEAYFFGDPQSLIHAGVSPQIHPQLANANVEDFLTNDPNPIWQNKCVSENNKQLALGHTWWQMERHPKDYLTHLITRTQRSTGYRPTRDGKAAFENLDWRAPTLINPQATLFARSLFEDLCDWFEDRCGSRPQNPLGPGATAPETYPPRSVNRAALLLRNI